MDPSLHRLRVAYRKSDRLAYLGHLEVLHTLERSVRRSQLPFDVSTGFARRMRLQFSQALPVGAASDGEYLDVGLTCSVDPDEALAALVRATPPQLAPFACAYVPTFLPALEAWLTRATWRVSIGTDGMDVSLFNAAMQGLAEEGTLSFYRGTKPRTVDLTSTLVGWEIGETNDTNLDLTIDTRSSSKGALRPAVLLDGVFSREEMAGIHRQSLSVTRAAQYHESDDGELMDAFDVSVSKICMR